MHHLPSTYRSECLRLVDLAHRHGTQVEWTQNYKQRVLLMRLTDEDDPFFLYQLTLSEEDFQGTFTLRGCWLIRVNCLGLRTEQSLLVDFATFPRKVIELMHECNNEEHNASPRCQAHQHWLYRKSLLWQIPCPSVHS